MISTTTASTSKFTVQTYIFDPRPAHPLRLSVKRYLLQNDSRSIDSGGRDVDAVSLVFAHGGGFHKELWEPLLDGLAVLLVEDPGPVDSKMHIRDIWTVDAPSHGDSATLNEDAAEYPPKQALGYEEYPWMMHLLLNGQGQLTATDPITDTNDRPESIYPFPKGKIIGIGHSMGAVALSLSLSYTPSPSRFSTLQCLILIEVAIGPDAFARNLRAEYVALTEKRKEVWSSRNEAASNLGRALGKAGWDERCVRSYVEFGLKPVDPTRPDGPVTLKCSKASEQVFNREWIAPMRLYTGLRELLDGMPVHAIYGVDDDPKYPEVLKKDVIENSAGGVQNFASFAKVPGGGHLVLYQNPGGVAKQIFEALRLGARAGASAGGRLVEGAGKGKL